MPLGIAVLYTECILPFYGIPSCIISDQDPHFIAQFIKELCKLLRIMQNISTAYHPQTDGQSEHANQHIEQYLQIYSNDERDDWVLLLPLAQYIHNTWKNESMNHTPFELLLGHTSTFQMEDQDITLPSLSERKEWLERNRLRAQASIRNSQCLLTTRMEGKKGQCHYQGFAVGDRVWLEGTNLHLSVRLKFGLLHDLCKVLSSCST
jgi:hypothetical protein